MEFAACKSIGEMKKTKSYSYEYLYERRVLENSEFRDDFEMDVFAISRDFKSHEELNNSFDLVKDEKISYLIRISFILIFMRKKIH